MNDDPASSVRPLQAADLPALKALIDAAGLFPGNLLDDMTAPFLTGAAAHERWWVLDTGEVAGVAYAAPERMTQGTWNLLLIAVHPDRQRQGCGARLLAHLEPALAGERGRLLLVETSGLPAFEGARAFYIRRGFAEEARIRDFYQPGEDKLVFWKTFPAVSAG